MLHADELCFSSGGSSLLGRCRGTRTGDSVLLLDVAYPSYGGALTVAGLEPVYLTCDRDTWLPQFDSVSMADVERCTCLLLNYPSNPTGTLAPPGFWEEVLEFCQQHDLLLIHDNPYVLQVRAH
jgi:aspartate/methionine/tyrosine aminotransferase